MVWVPMVPGGGDKVRVKHETPSYQAIGRLAPGASVAAAAAEMKGIQQDVATQYTDPDYRDRVSSVHVARYEDTLVEDSVRKSLLALGGASAVLWLIACVNVTSLLLARATARQREIAVRGALGASRWRIVQQLLIEGLMLSSVASLLGVALAMLTLRAFEHGLQDAIQHLHDADAEPARAGRAAAADGGQRGGVLGVAGDRSGQSTD